MKPHPQAIFETLEDLVSWDKYELQNDLIDELSEFEKQQARAGIRYLRVLLGEDFLRSSAEENNPIFFWYFRDSSSGARRSLIRFGEKVKTLESASNFNGLVARLKTPERAAEALTVLDTADKLWRAGFCVSFDPKTTSGSVPDLRLVDSDNGDDIYVEVSRLRKGGHQQLGSRTYHVIFTEVLNAIWSCPESWDFTKPHVLPYVRILKSLSEKDLAEVVGKIRALIFEAAARKTYLEYQFKDAIEMAVSSADDHSEAEAWAAERNMKDLVEPPPIPLNQEIRKARGKILTKSAQLPEHEPGIIVIPASESLMFFTYRPEQIILEIAEELRQHRNLLCAVVSHSFVGGEQKPSVVTLGQHNLITTMTNQITTRTALVMNGAFGLSVAATTIEKMRKAFLDAR